MDQQELARALRKRDQSVYEDLMEEHSRLLWTIAAGILAGTGTREDVEEVIPDVFVELWQRPERFDPRRGEIRTFLCLKTRTRAIDRLRKLCRAPQTPLEDVEEPAAPDPLETLLARRTAGEVRRLLGELDPPDREILTLRLLYEVKPADIAAKLHLPVKQIYERIRRGKAYLASALEQEGLL